jgi:hypothetical protein
MADRMLGAFTPPDVVEPGLTADLSIAAVNGPWSTAVARPPASLTTLARRLPDRGHKARALSHIEGDKIRGFPPRLEQLVTGGMITLEPVRVTSWRDQPGTPKTASSGRRPQ